MVNGRTKLWTKLCESEEVTFVGFDSGFELENSRSDGTAGLAEIHTTQSKL